ncbi:MAG TPA: hypothetical protein VNF47_21315 [Streptosporangiaceae bacterium]|nr:hypothetical protein [Streptosporangiaceae bacterium]
MTQSKSTPVASAPSATQDPPSPVLMAMNLMYAGAALTVVGLVLSVIAIAGDAAALHAGHPHASAAQIHATQNLLITSAVVQGLIEVGLWLLMARMNRAGVRWARIIASVLFALSTWNLVAHLISTTVITNLVYTVLLWLIGLGAVFFLWQRESSAYFS